MEKITGKETAYPLDSGYEGFGEQTGLTIRQKFAYGAMLALNPPIEKFITGYQKDENKEIYEEWARKCIRMADTLITELNK